MIRAFVLVALIFMIGLLAGGLMAFQADLSSNTQAYSVTSRAIVQHELQLAEAPEPLKAVPQTSGNQPLEQASPYDWIAEQQIDMRQNGVFINLADPQWAILADTNSMDPAFDIGSHLIQKTVTSVDQVHVGDIISYESPFGYVIVHRIIEIGQDENGWYAIAKGDNNPAADPWKVRFNQITRVTVAIIY